MTTEASTAGRPRSANGRFMSTADAASPDVSGNADAAEIPEVSRPDGKQVKRPKKSKAKKAEPTKPKKAEAKKPKKKSGGKKPKK